MNHPSITTTAVLLIALISGCTSYLPNDQLIGENREKIIRTLGAPLHERKTANNSILVFSRGFQGNLSFFVYLDDDGKLVRWEQVLNEKNFALIKPDMHRDDVTAILGPAIDTYGLARDRGYVWNYRYVNAQCFWFNIEFTKDHVVRSTGYSKPKECRPKGL